MSKKSTSLTKLQDRIKSMARSNREKVKRMKEGGIIETGIGSLTAFAMGAAEAHGHHMPTLGPVDTTLPLGILAGAVALNTRGGLAATAAGVAQGSLTVWSFKQGLKQTPKEEPKEEAPAKPTSGFDDEFEY